MAEEQKAKYEIIYDMGTELYIAKVQLAELKEQDINARIMKNEMQDQLTANIKNRGELESLPLIALMGEKLEIISGHHRVKSAREAGLKEIIVILDKSGLTRSKAASKQLAHNAISGFDDESTLREIVKLMDNVDDMMESYIGKEILEEPLEQFDKLNTPAVQFDFKTIAFAFLPNQIRDLDALMKNLNGRLVYAIVCYADDFTIYGDVSKLKKAMKKATIWAHDKFGLKIKDIWQFYQVASFDEERENLEERRKGSKKRTPGVDMMGYVVRRRYTIIRGRVFRRIRRQVLRAWEDFKAKGFIPWWRACRIAAYKGWIKHSNSLKFRMEYCFDKLFKMCSYSASKHGKEVENEKRILLITALSS